MYDLIYEFILSILGNFLYDSAKTITMKAIHKLNTIFSKLNIHLAITEKNIRQLIKIRKKCKTKEEFISYVKKTDPTLQKLFPNCKIIQSDIISFGKYPQTVCDNNYLFDVYNKTIEIVSTPYEEGYMLSNGNILPINKKIYFNNDPILWKILDINHQQNEALIITVNILDCVKFDTKYYHHAHRWMRDSSPSGITPNTWKNSFLQRWCNEEFLNTAFDTTEQNKIKLVNLNNQTSNDIETSRYSWLIQENTSDKIFIPSFEDLTSQKYQFDNNFITKDINRKSVLTDYAIAKGCQPVYSTNTPYGWYWTRTPGDPLSLLKGEDVIDSQRRVMDVMHDGSICKRGSVVGGDPDDRCDGSANGVRPMMVIKLDYF